MNRLGAMEVAASHPLFAKLERRVLDSVVGASSTLTYRTGRTFLHEGDPPDRVYVLVDGSVRVFHRARNGAELVVKLFRAPAFFGEMEVLARRPFLEYVTALSSVTVIAVPAAVFRRLVRGDVNIASTVALDLAKRLCIATVNERNLAFYDVDTRLINLLLDYADLCGTAQRDGMIEFALRVTQSGLARDLAVNRKSVLRSLARLEQQGLIVRRGRHIVLPDLERLRRAGTATLSLHYRSEPCVIE